MGIVVMETKPITFASSADTKRNAYTFHCRELDTRQHYAACLHKIELRKNGRLREIWSDCSVAISKGLCPAIDMREAETEKGIALYFLERIRFIGLEAFVDSAREFFAPQRKGRNGRVLKEKPGVATKPVKTTTPDELDLDIDDTSFSDVINKAVTKVEVKPAVIAKQGESLLETARRLLAARK
jgi:hypothetical protein